MVVLKFIWGHILGISHTNVSSVIKHFQHKVILKVIWRHILRKSHDIRSCQRPCVVLCFWNSLIPIIIMIHYLINYVRGVKRLAFFTYPLGPPPRNMLLYGPIRSIIFILQNFEVLPPVRGVWKLLKMVKKLEFSKLW